MRRFNPEKELYKIQHGRRNKIIFSMLFGIILLTIGYSFALYQVRYNKRIIYTKVAPFSNKDIELAVYLDGSPSNDNDFPEKNSGYVYEKTLCDNSSTAFFDNVGWNLYLKANKKDRCDVYFVNNDGTPNPPELYQGLIPVTFDNGKVLVANPTNNDWYNYDTNDKRWANAVLVNSTKYYDLVYEGVLKEDKYGTEISMNDILQMYVWIPRYKYQLFNVNNSGVEEQEIKIQFENGIDNTGNIECKYTNNNNGTITEKCTEKGTEVNVQNGDWYTHPAFTFKGTFEESGTELKGIWVGKFESSGSATALTIKPNITSLREVNINTMFDASRNIEEQYANTFNLNNTQIDTHQMKNIEWGAMAYLTQSKYGRCDGNNNCKEVTANSNSNFITGYANTGYAWQTETGQLASTTGNIYGIYDTNGGAWEDVMGNMVNASGAFLSSQGGFSVAPDSKYYDVYEYDASSGLTHARGHLGDATREILKIPGNAEGGWYSDASQFLYNTYVWFVRGGCYPNGSRIGSFAFSINAGGGDIWFSFRVVLTAQDGDS